MKHNMNSTLKVGDKVFKENTRNKHRTGGKLENRWNGPFVIHKDLGKGRYYLETLAGKVLKQTIHCARLKLFLKPVGDKETICSVVDEEAVSAQGDDNASELRNCGANEKDDGNGTIIQDGSGDKENGVIDGDSEGIREQHEGSPTEKEMSGSRCTASVYPSSSSTIGIETESGEGIGEIGSRQGHRTSSVF